MERIRWHWTTKAALFSIQAIPIQTAEFNGAADGWLFDGSDASSTNPNQATDIFAIGYYGQQRRYLPD